MCLAAITLHSSLTHFPTPHQTKGGAYFQGECHDFGQFGQEGKVTGAVQRSNGKVSATIQMIARGPSQAVTTSFNFVGFVNKEGVYSGTFSACEISKVRKERVWEVLHARSRPV